MNLEVAAGGALAGLGCALVAGQLLPARPSLRAAIARLETTAQGSAEPPAIRARIGAQVARSAPWLPVPSADLRLLDEDTTAWLAAKVIAGVVGVALVPVLAALAGLAGHPVGWTLPAGGALLLGAVFFFVPDLVTRMNAAEKRTDFRDALTSYIDLVVLQRGAGAAPTEALEAAATAGDGWAFARIAAALDQARKVGIPPWHGLAELAADTGVHELADLADIASAAGEEGTKILDTLAARAASMRAEALAAAKEKAGARSTTMALPVALLAIGFVLLLVFPAFYRLFG